MGLPLERYAVSRAFSSNGPPPSMPIATIRRGLMRIHAGSNGMPAPIRTPTASPPSVWASAARGPPRSEASTGPWRRDRRRRTPRRGGAGRRGTSRSRPCRCRRDRRLRWSWSLGRRRPPTGVTCGLPSGPTVARRPSGWLFRYSTSASVNVPIVPPMLSRLSVFFSAGCRGMSSDDARSYPTPCPGCPGQSFEASPAGKAVRADPVEFGHDRRLLAPSVEGRPVASEHIQPRQRSRPASGLHKAHEAD
jgi:hypothetical protein